MERVPSAAFASDNAAPAHPAVMEALTRVNQGPAPAYGTDPVTAQARDALVRIAAALGDVGASLTDVVRTRMFVTDITAWREIGSVHDEVFGAVRPTATMVEVSALISPELVVEIEVDAIVP